MSWLYERIYNAIEENRYLIGAHAANRLDLRGIEDWQVVAGFAEGELIEVRPNDRPNATIVMEEILPDGTPVIAVWSWLPVHKAAKLVTVYYPER